MYFNTSNCAARIYAGTQKKVVTMNGRTVAMNNCADMTFVLSLKPSLQKSSDFIESEVNRR